MTDAKLKKILITTFILCVVIIIIEAIYSVHVHNQNEKKNVYYDNYTMSIMDKKDIVSVGSSYFKYSKLNKYTDGYEKGKLIKRDKDGNILFEFQYDKGNNSTFTSIVEKDGFYYVTGSGEYSEEQTKNNLRDAFLIKFDKNGKKIWEKYYGVLANTRFTKAILIDDGLIVIGSSLYENMEVGNHKTGGGIIVKYDFDGKEIWHNNHGGNKSGQFNDVIEIDGNFYVVGKDGADSANFVMFDKDGKYKWHKNYSYTDNRGNQSLVYFNDLIYVVGSKKILGDEEKERKTDNTDGLVIVYDKDGNVKNELTFGGKSFERFTGAIVKGDYLYITGISSSTDMKNLKIELEEKEDGETIYSTVILKYDKDLKLIDSEVLGGNNNDMLTNITLTNNELLVSGLSNTKKSNISIKKNNGKDYFGKIIKLKDDLKFEVIE